MRYLVLVLLLAGCAQSGINPNGSRTCVAREGYSLTVFDGVGRLPASTPHGDVTTLKVCDGSLERVVRVRGLVPGNLDDNQQEFLTDGHGHIATEARLVTISKTEAKLNDLNLQGVCVELWDGGCDAALGQTPTPEAPTSTGTPTPNPS